MNSIDPLKLFLERYCALSSEAWEDVKALFKLAILHKGDLFVREGKVEKQVAFQLSGVSRTYFVSPEGKEYNKAFNLDNSFIGAYSSLISGDVNQINIQALTDCQLLIADYSSFLQLLTKYHELETFLRKLAESYFIQKEKRELELTQLDASQRYDLFRKRHPRIENSISQYHIASYLGITPTQLSRIRAEK